MFVPWVIFHVLVCIALVLVVLMQSSKGEGLAGGTAFGGGVTGAVFGGRGAASFLSKATTVLAVVFMVNCGALALMSSQGRDVVMPTQTTDTASPQSAVTQKALEEQEAQRQRMQEQQMQQLQDTAGAIDLNNLGQPEGDTGLQIQVVPQGENPQPQSSGGGE